jgi:hypothetical protein
MRRELLEGGNTMTFKTLLFDLGKLVVAGAAFAVGIMIGGMLATALQLPPPGAPEGADMSTVGTYSMLTTPLLALALAVLARGLAGGFLTRAAVLTFFMWIAYAVNTQLEATIVSTYAGGVPYAVVMYLVAAVFCGTAVAFLFPAEKSSPGTGAVVKAFWARRRPLDWAWRLALAAVVFMPIYFAFGLMVLPFTGEYYRENMFGLVAPTIEQLLPILFVRSVLFLLCTLPIIMLWQKSDRILFWRLGLALFLLVGFVIMLYATWLPLYVRIPHILEILADEFVYAGVLVLLLGEGTLFARRVARLARQQSLP